MKKPNMFKRSNRLDAVKKEASMPVSRNNTNSSNSAFSRRTTDDSSPRQQQHKNDGVFKGNTFRGRTSSQKNEQKKQKKQEFVAKDGDFPSLDAQALPLPLPSSTALNFAKNIKDSLVCEEKEESVSQEDRRIRELKLDGIMLLRLKKIDYTEDRHIYLHYLQTGKYADGQSSEEYLAQWEAENYLERLEDPPNTSIIQACEVDNYIEEEEWEARWEKMAAEQYNNGNGEEEDNESVASDLEYW